MNLVQFLVVDNHSFVTFGVRLMLEKEQDFKNRGYTILCIQIIREKNVEKNNYRNTIKVNC